MAPPVEVRVPVAVACARPATPEPAWNLAHLAQNAGDVDKLRAALADLEFAHGYIKELKAELAACG